MQRRQATYKLVVALAVLLSAADAHAQRDVKDIPVPDPEVERQALEMAPGFQVELFAADPLLAKPIQMNFDPQGRLWIATSEVYPHIKPGQKADDKVIRLEDRDGDGKADVTTVFADGLLIPTGVEPGDGGVYVADSTDLVFFKDTDGDGRADEKRIVLSGFGTEDTHHILHTLRWGPDGFLYMNQSIYIHSHVETPHGVRRLGGGGIWQFRPENMWLDVYARGLVNPWGHQLDDYGQSFATDGAGGEGINYIVPGAYYATAVGASRILQGLNPGSPKYCGMEIVGGRHLPDDWQGNIITNDFRGHRVCRFVIREESSGFASFQQEDLIKSSHVAFRPIDVKMGPDGAIYIADWYNPIIQHGEVDFRDERRDHTHGRIWRVTCSGRPLVKKPRLVDAAGNQLLDYLKSPEPWTRQNAKRVLQERGRRIAPNVIAWAHGLKRNDPLYEHHLLEALWTLQSVDVPNHELLEQLLDAKDHRVRAAATRVVWHWQDRIGNALELLAARIHDPHPRVRLEAVRALARVNNPQAIRLALDVLDAPMDRFLDYGLWLAAREQRDNWLPAVRRGDDWGGDVRKLVFALKSVASPETVPPLLALLVQNKIAAAEVPDVLRTVENSAGPAELAAVLVLATGEQTPGALRQRLLFTLLAAAQRRGVKPAGDPAAIGSFLDSSDVELQALAARLIGAWKLESLRSRLTALAESETTRAGVRGAAIEGLSNLEGTASVPLFEKIASGGNASIELRKQAVVALINVDAAKAAKRALDLLSNADASGNMGENGEVVRAFLSTDKATEALTNELASRTIPADLAIVTLRTVRSSGKAQAALEAALTKAGNISSGPKKLTPQETKDLIAEIAERGNARHGEVLFRREELACFKCHAIGGSGGSVGPDLISLGASAQLDYLIESLVDPAAKVKENYHTVVVVDDDGKTHSGIKVRQSDTALILRDAEDREMSIPLSKIEQQTPGTSLMPAGLTEKLTRSELVDLVRFLSELGKVGAYSVGKEPVARRWRAMEATKDAALQLGRTSYGSAADAGQSAFNWKTAYSTVSGMLPLTDLPEIRVKYRTPEGTRGMAFVYCEFDVAEAGQVRLSFNEVTGLVGWMDGVQLDLKTETLVDFNAGRRRLTLAVDLAKRTEPVRVGLLEAPGSTARVQIVGGK